MLALTPGRLLRRPPYAYKFHPQRVNALYGSKRRTFVSSALHTLGEGFLDLAIALPYPQSLPPYSSTIILVTVISRLFLTVPFSIWAKKRQWRGEDLVVPQLKEERARLIKQIPAEMRKDRFRGNEDEARMEFEKRLRPLIKTKQKELFAKHKCSPTVTALIPIVSQLPIFVGSSMILARLSEYPTVFESESFLTLTSLAHSDPTLTLPIVLGLITMANVESSRFFISSEALERERKVAKWAEERRAKGHTVVQPKKILQSALRIMAVGRILLAALVPGSVQLYWVTSATFGLLQTWVLDYWDTKRTRVAHAVTGKTGSIGSQPLSESVNKKLAK